MLKKTYLVYFLCCFDFVLLFNMARLFLLSCRTSDRRSHQLRYVLRNKTTEEVYLVVVFSLFLREDIDEHGNLKEGAEQHIAGGDRTTTTAAADNEHTHDETEALKQARDEFGTPHNETNEDDVD